MNDLRTDSRARALLRELFDAAVTCANPKEAVWSNLPSKPRGRCVVIGPGSSDGRRGRCRLARCRSLGNRGCAVRPHSVGGQDRSRRSIAPRTRRKKRNRGSTHPSCRARPRQRRPRPGPDVRGGSALMSMPAAGITLSDKQAINRSLPVLQGLDN